MKINKNRIGLKRRKEFYQFGMGKQKDNEAIAWNKYLDMLLKIIDKVENKKDLDYRDWGDLDNIKGVTSLGGHHNNYMDRMMLCKDLMNYVKINSPTKTEGEKQ